MRATTALIFAVVALLIMGMFSNYLLYMKGATPARVVEVSRHQDLQQFLVECFDEEDEGFYTVAYVDEYQWDLAEEVQLCSVNVFN